MIYRILEYTAWRMEAPRMYGPFHLIISISIICMAVFFALRAKRLSDSGRVRRLTVCGWILVVMEVYKQLFLFYIVNDRVYDWWYFPFQLCSVPMYLCVLLPLLARDAAEENASSPRCVEGPATGSKLTAAGGTLPAAVLTFLASYIFIGAAATFAVPEDILRPYVTLTLHGFIWHGILLFISLTAAFTGLAGLTRSSFARATGLFLVMCVTAVIINIAAEPVMRDAHSAGLLTNSYAAMFYLNPYHISPQPVIDTIQKSAGIPLGLALYVIIIILAAGAACYVLSRFRRSR